MLRSTRIFISMNLHVERIAGIITIPVIIPLYLYWIEEMSCSSAQLRLFDDNNH